jgi:hypothetical protein
MESLIFDSGIKEYKINGNGILRFNPSDPSVYGRFVDAMDDIKAVETEMTKKAKKAEGKQGQELGEAMIKIMCETDQKMKAILNGVFGHGNNFDEILEGVNLMAVASNGNRVVTNLLNALQPLMEEGAKACASDAVETAKMNRAARRAAQ